MSVEIQRRLTSVLRRIDSKEHDDLTLRILVHPSILERLRCEDEALLARMQSFHDVKLTFRADASFHVENFKIVNADTGEEYN
jgi:ribonuclease G